MNTLKLLLMGPPKVNDSGEWLKQLSSKTMALLFYLAVTGCVHSREALATLLWSESPDNKARISLRKALFDLRQVAGDYLLITSQELAFDRQSPYWLDVEAFEHSVNQVLKQPESQPSNAQITALEEALALYRGDFLAGFSVRDAPLFNEWVLGKQEWLRQAAVQALAVLTAHYAARQDYIIALDCVNRSLSLDNWREESHRYKMLLLALQGQRSEAMMQYETCSRILREELNAEPGQGTTTIYQHIRDEDTSALLAFLPTGQLPLPSSPYRGLFAFREQDAAFFFGREAFAQRLLQSVHRLPLVAVVGPSGSGKSSLAFAGLLPLLRSQKTWLVAAFRLGKQPFQALASALLPLLGPEWPATHQLAQALEQGRVTLPELVEQILAQVPAASRLLLLIDQFEDVWGNDELVRRRFLSVLLTGCRGTETPRCTRLLTLRADFMGQALAFRPLADALQDAVLILGPMTRDEMAQAIEKPALQQRIDFEAGLVERILDDVGEQPGKLSLLEFMLEVLWQRQTVGNLLSHAAYDQVGQVNGALTRYAEEVYAGLDQAEQQQARRVLVQLVQPGENTPDTRRISGRAELGEAGWELAGRLADARLVVVGRDPGGGETVELVHEVLIDSWSRLQTWLQEERSFRVWQERMRVALRQWESNERDAGGLLRGASLAEAMRWLLERETDLSQTGRDFIQASLAERDQRRMLEMARQAREIELEQRGRNRLRALVAVLSVAVLVSLALMLFALDRQHVAQREAAISHSLSLATSAQLALAEDDTDLALALALAANQLDDPPPQAQLMLAEAAYAPGTRRRLTGHTVPVEGLAILPGGLRALSASADHSLVLWDLENGQALRRLEGHTAAIHDVALLPDDRRALSASADGTLILWDIESGQALRYFTGHTGDVWCVAVSPNGQQALSGSADGSLILWDIESGQVQRRLEGHTGAVYSAAISPAPPAGGTGGQQALSGSADRSLILWDLESGQMQYRMAGADSTVAGSRGGLVHFDSIWGVAFLPDGRSALSASQDEFAAVWDLESGQLAWSLDVETGLFSLALSPNGRTALLGTLNNRLLVLDLESRKITQQLHGHTARVQAVAFTPNGRGALSGASTGALRLWDLNNGAEIRRITYSDPPDPAAADVAISPDGRLGLTGLWTGQISLWDVASGEEVGRLVGHTEMVFGGVHFLPAPLAGSAGGRRAVSGSGDIYAVSDDHSVRVWDVESGQELRRFEGHTDKIWDTDVSADGGWVASGSHDGTLRLWDLESGQDRVLLDVSPQGVRSVAFSPDARYVVAGLCKGQANAPDYDLRLLEVETGREVRRLVGHKEVVADVAFSPDGKLILSGSSDRSLIVWDVASGTLIHRLTEQTSGPLSVAFSPDCGRPMKAGCLALSGAIDGSLLLWDVEAGVALRRYAGIAKPVVGLAFAPDGRSFFVAADDDAVHEFHVDATPEDLAAWIAANRYVPELSCEQQVRYRVTPPCN